MTLVTDGNIQREKKYSVRGRTLYERLEYYFKNVYLNNFETETTDPDQLARELFLSGVPSSIAAKCANAKIQPIARSVKEIEDIIDNAIDRRAEYLSYAGLSDKFQYGADIIQPLVDQRIKMITYQNSVDKPKTKKPRVKKADETEIKKESNDDAVEQKSRGPWEGLYGINVSQPNPKRKLPRR